MRIAIIDDLIEDRESLKEVLVPYLNKYDFTTEYDEFDSGEDFLSHFIPGLYDICFMDIYMKELSGMDAARQIAAKDPECFIIFLTTSTDYVFAGYDIRAWRYLLKPIYYDKLAEILDPCFEQLILSKRFLTVTVKRRDFTVPFSRISFIASVNRTIELHMIDRMLALSAGTVYTNVSEPLLSDSRFLSCGKGLIINMQQIGHLDKDVLIMRSGERVPVSRRKMAFVKDSFLQYTLKNL